MSELLVQWQQIATFWVPGVPVGQPRPRARAMQAFSRKKGRKVWVAQVYNAPDADGWKDAVRFHSLSQRPERPIEGPVRVDVIAFLPRPKYMMAAKWPEGPVLHTAKPDRDNLDKPVLDGLGAAGWWRDDAQACAGEVVKVYCAKHGATGATIEVSVPADPQGELLTGT